MNDNPGPDREKGTGMLTGWENTALLMIGNTCTAPRSDVCHRNPRKEEQMKALVVDDDLEVRTAIRAIVKLAGYEQVDTAASAKDALVLAFETHYALVTLDLQMPVVSGFEILPVIRGRSPHSIIAIISGYTDRIPKEKMTYADLVLSKPFQAETIRNLAQLAKDMGEKYAAICALSGLSDVAGGEEEKRSYV